MAEGATNPLRELVYSHRDEIKAIVARHHGRTVALFGSVARGDERSTSDIDFLVELEPGTRAFELRSRSCPGSDRDGGRSWPKSSASALEV